MSKLAKAVKVTSSYGVVPYTNDFLFDEVYSSDVSYTNHDLGILYHIGAKFNVDMIIPREQLDTIVFDESVKLAKRKIIEAVFGEFRPYLIKLHEDLYNRDYDSARNVLAKIEQEMFEI